MKTKKENSEEKPKKDKFLPEEILNSSKQMTRRSFISAFGRVVGLGIVVSKVAVFAASTPQDPNAPCPSGLSAEDLCTTKENDTCISGSIHTDECIKGGDSDRCPGNAEPDDSCPTGAKIEDNCFTNREPEDKCPQLGNNAYDNCESGRPAEDICLPPGFSTDDSCYTGTEPDDICKVLPSTDELGDQCQGGNGDECNPKGVELADGCPKSAFAGGILGYEDDCHAYTPTEEPTDGCYKTNDDTCHGGKNTDDYGKNGYDDFCNKDEDSWLNWGSDQCNSGRDDDDRCLQATDAEGWNDVCPGGGIDVDKCFFKNELQRSEDYCNSSLANNDECSQVQKDEDVCSSGKSGDDICNPDVSGDDICFSSKLEDDQCSHRNNDPNDACPSGGSYAFSAQDRCSPGYGITDIPE